MAFSRILFIKRALSNNIKLGEVMKLILKTVCINNRGKLNNGKKGKMDYKQTNIG